MIEFVLGLKAPRLNRGAFFIVVLVQALGLVY